MKSWLLLDVNYLCHRAWHTHGSLEFQDVHTGVIYGVLRDIVTLQDRFMDHRIAFCFDRKPLLREQFYPQYKKKRNQKDNYSEEEIESKKMFDRQVKLLRTEYLKELGYKNVFYQRGYEADDIIASVVLSVPQDEFVIVSSDKDLYQLLNRRVSIWNPRTKFLTTQKTFEKEFGVTPTQWIDVKAIAGCYTDGIKGVEGVGEKTAAKFLNGTIVPGSKSFKAIVKGNEIWKRNRHLVKLPYPGVETFTLQKDKVHASSWKHLAHKLGMRSIQDKPPRKKEKEGLGIV